ncbi:uncharacterized protein LOC135217785 [Macrobrachium nipponense]|uniref:uncharacterized protein LOC135217785 n=1 Tax=Macrobrachium nipponense TaxID=159736 RepID=UPI0030C8BCF7
MKSSCRSASQSHTMKTSALLIYFISVCTTVTGQEVTPSPDSEFLVQPSNVTVPVGEQVILKCKTASKTQLCRWYFLELDLKFFDKRVTPLQVKEFSPHGRQDCSIKIAKIRKVQEGQWLCQALKFQSSKFIMSKPVVVRVITESESATWEPPKGNNTDFTPRNGRREGETSRPGEVGFKFQSTEDDIIKDVFIHETAVLKCQVDKPIETCSWITPRGENITATQGQYEPLHHSNITDGFRIIGNLSEGNCSIEISNVARNNEGNWHCTVHDPNAGQDIQGPLLHLHILDYDTASKHTHDEMPLANENQDQANFLVISLVTIAGILFITVLLLLIFLYNRLKGSQDERQKILQTSPRNSLDLQTKTSSTNDLTLSSVIAVEPRKKLSAELHHRGYYNQYLDMSGSGSNVGDGYIMMPGSSIRSSTSSRTTLSTLSTLPIGRSRSASNSTTDSGIFPHLTTIIDNPSYNPGAVSGRRLPHRPDSVYSNDHVYEEIKDKIDEIISKMENIPEINSPTYTNTAVDSEGYLVPKISPSNTMLELTEEKNLPMETAEIPVTNNSTCTDVQTIQSANELHERPPYSVVGSSGLVLPVSTCLDQLDPHPGYSKVGENIQNKSDPMEKYDIPRQIPALPINNYDIPKPNPTPVNSPLNSTLKTTDSDNGLSGIIV